MKDFIASNGRRLWIDDHGHVRGEYDAQNTVTYVKAENFEMLAEFFQAEADERLGRWRWPENPHIYVTAEHLGFVNIIDERDPVHPGTWERYWRDTKTELDRAAVAYFDAHPEPKPWHDAAEGEIWALTVNGREAAWLRRIDVWERVTDAFLLRNAPASEGISAGHRVWPEVAA